MIERRAPDPVKVPGPQDQVCHFLLDAFIFENTGLQFYVDADPRVLQQIEDLLQRGDPCHFSVFRPGQRNVQFPQLRERTVPDKTAHAADTVHGLVMDHHDLSVFRQLYIQFYTVRAHLRSPSKSIQCILRHRTGSAPVAPNFRHCICHLCFCSLIIYGRVALIRRVCVKNFMHHA